MFSQDKKSILEAISCFLKAEQSFIGEHLFVKQSSFCDKQIRNNVGKGKKSSSVLSYDLKNISSLMDKDLDTLKTDIQKCQKCSLCLTRKNTVFGEGSLQSKIFFVGEAPGQKEDETGMPFVGRAGLLLNKMIQAMGLKREEVFIANVIKCRPPKNRNPLPIEIENCFPFLEKQIELLSPKIICTLGHFASKTLLNEHKTMGMLRGKIFSFKGIPLIPTFHPAYLLRNPSMKKISWKDLQMVMDLLKKIP